MQKILTLIALLGAIGNASADTLVLENGKTLRVKSYTVEGNRLQVLLTERGELVIPLEWVKEIRPSLPDPEVTAAASDMREVIPFAYSEIVVAAAKKHQVDWRLIEAVVAIESNYNPRAIDQYVEDSVAQPKFYMLLLGIFAAIALVLASILHRNFSGSFIR